MGPSTVNWLHTIPSFFAPRIMFFSSSLCARLHLEWKIYNRLRKKKEIKLSPPPLDFGRPPVTSDHNSGRLGNGETLKRTIFFVLANRLRAGQLWSWHTDTKEGKALGWYGSACRWRNGGSNEESGGAVDGWCQGISLARHRIEHRMESRPISARRGQLPGWSGRANGIKVEQEHSTTSGTAIGRSAAAAGTNRRSFLRRTAIKRKMARLVSYRAEEPSVCFSWPSHCQPGTCCWSVLDAAAASFLCSSLSCCTWLVPATERRERDSTVPCRLQGIKATRRAGNLVSCQCGFVFISGGLRPLRHYGTVQTYYRKSRPFFYLHHHHFFV